MKIYTKKYKINFKNYEINLFDTYEMENRRKKLMSLYSFLLKISEFGASKISFSSLLRRFNKSTKKYKMALTTLKDAIKSLINLGLLKIIDKARGVNVYSFLRFNFDYFYGDNPTKIRPKNPTCGELSKTVESTGSLEIASEHKYISVKIDKDIDVKDDAKKSYKEFICSEEKVNDLETVINHAKKLFKSLNIKNEFIKDKVLAQLTKYSKTITIKFLDNYILKTIEKAKSNFKSYKIKISNEKRDNKAKSLRFNNFDQRNYNYDQIDLIISGEKSFEDVKDNLINKENPISKFDRYSYNNSNTLKFNNFDQRNYDYDDLEKKLSNNW